MKHFRAISIGAMVRGLLFISFAILGIVPSIKDSLYLQASAVGVLIVPFTIFWASIFYKNGNKESGITVILHL